jgi:diguanylate cyclase (GGDEF)-like protein
LRACAGMSASIMTRLERQFVAEFEFPRPEPFDLAQLRQLLRESGIDDDSAAALLLLVERHAPDLGREIALPPEVASLPAQKKRELLESIEPAFERQLAFAPPAFSVLAFDHTPAVDARDLTLAIATRRTATLLVLRGRSLGKLYKLEGSRFLVGRATTADIVLDDDGVSRFHAVITQEAARFRVEDLGSKNGIIVNGFKVSDHVLDEGDRIQLGATTLLKFTHQDDIEEQFQEELYKSVTVDPLTGIYNRRHLIERLRSECAYARRQGTFLSVLMIDVDHFKQVNDTHGHLAGDAVLREVAKAIQTSLRTEDVFGRYGGEELCVLLRGIEAANAELAGNRIVELVRALVVEYGGKELRMTVSVGTATSAANVLDTPQELLDAADRALYRAKEGGRDRCSV